MFGLFRKKMTLENAVSTVVNRIVSYDTNSDEMFAQESAFVACFAIFFCIRFTRHPSWKRNAKIIYDQFMKGFVKHLNIEFDSTELNLQKILDRIDLYSTAINISSSNPTPSNVSNEIGITFAIVQGKENDEETIHRGARIFMKETNSMFDLFKKFDLIV
ncbi:MAG: hypothetical protein M0P27_05070 [Bacteroidales bacterium]|nr:hypothetical protein [Bacteroidales bacterium]